MPKAKKLPSGNWRVQILVNGKRQSVTAPTKREAEYKAASIALSRSNVTDLTLQAAVKRYIESKDKILSPLTIKSYWQIYNLRLEPLADMRISKITALDMQNYINQLSVRFSPKTVKNAYGLVLSSINLVHPGTAYNVTLPAAKKMIRSLPTPEDIMDIVKGSDIELPILMLMCLGLRRSELIALRASDINGHFLTINNVMIVVNGESVMKERPKTYDSTRSLHIPDFLYQRIVELNKHGDQFLFDFTAMALYRRFIRLQTEAGYSGIRLHDLRHINASVMLALHVPEKYAMERGGWSSNKTLQTIYQHTYSDAREQVDNAIDSYFENIAHGIAHDKK